MRIIPFVLWGIGVSMYYGYLSFMKTDFFPFFNPVMKERPGIMGPARYHK
jgi:hypothetical protein